MNRNSYFTISLFLLTLTNIVSQNTTSSYRSEYYAHLPFWESPYQPFKLASQINEKEARKRIHVQVDYDTQNRVVTLHIKIGKHYKSYEGFFGNIYINAPLTTVEYEDNKELHSFYDRFGNQISVQGKVYTKVYEKDRYGRNIKLTFIDSKGDQTIDQTGVESYNWIHQSDGSIIEERFNLKGAVVPLRGVFQFDRTRMTFDNQGYFTTLQNIDDNGNLANSKSGAAVFRYYYDSEGRFDRWEVYDENGNKAIGPSDTSGEQNTYYQYDLKDIIFFNTKGDPATHWSGAERWHFEVDKYGNNTYLEFKDSEGNAINANNGFSKYEWSWSENGRYLLTEAYYDRDHQRTVHKSLGIHRIEYVRGDNGLIIEKKYSGVDGSLTNRLDTGIAIEKIIYDQNNLKSESTYYDKDGKIVRQ